MGVTNRLEQRMKRDQMSHTRNTPAIITSAIWDSDGLPAHAMMNPQKIVIEAI